MHISANSITKRLVIFSELMNSEEWSTIIVTPKALVYIARNLLTIRSKWSQSKSKVPFSSFYIQNWCGSEGPHRENWSERRRFERPVNNLKRRRVAERKRRSFKHKGRHHCSSVQLRGGWKWQWLQHFWEFRDLGISWEICRR